MSHVRQQIREAVATALTGLATTGARVYQSRLHPLDQSKLPCLLINTNDEQAEIASLGMPALLHRTLDLSIRAVAKVSANLDDTLDTILAEVETVLGNTTLGGLVKVLEPQNISIEMVQGDKPVGIATISYKTNYMTVANAPQIAI